jgi:hypothetical protein
MNPAMIFPLLPLLSEEDKAESSEGGLDPLGLTQIAETMAVRLVPGVRERMVHPRYLTLIAVGLEVCREFGSDTFATDGVSQPWQVFEWMVVEGFARHYKGRLPFKLPGSDKASSALRAKVPLSSRSYLKTPGVFGFHGVYRLLSRDVEIEEAGRLGELGDALLKAWSKEQQLGGFSGTSGGDGAKTRSQLAAAVRDSLDSSAVARRDGWQLWDFFQKHLSPHQVGRAEATLLRDALMTPGAGYREQVMNAVVSDAAIEAYAKDTSERAFHGVLRKQAGSELGQLLDAISAYEAFSRNCQDAFDDILVEMTNTKSGKVTTARLASIKEVADASKRAPELFAKAAEQLDPVSLSGEFTKQFAALGEKASASEWVGLLLQHHVEVQRRKPPQGKNPWFERFDGGGYVIRPLYRRDLPGRHDDRYLHAYRTGTLLSFAHDLHLIGQ